MDKIEQHIREIASNISPFHHITFTLLRCNDGTEYFYGFYGSYPEKSYSFNSIDEAKAFINEREILFRKFGR